MKLRDWLEARPEMTQEKLAQKLSTSQPRISQILRDGTNDLAMALKIEAITGGFVTVSDLAYNKSRKRQEAAE